MTMRDKIAAVMWRTQAEGVGAPASVANARTPEAFADESRETRNTWLKQADAIIAALPVLVPDLEWEKTTDHWQASDRLGGRYEVFRLSGGRSTAHHLVRGYGVQIGDGSSMGSDIAAANAHHRAAVCKMMGL